MSEKMEYMEVFKKQEPKELIQHMDGYTIKCLIYNTSVNFEVYEIESTLASDPEKRFYEDNEEDINNVTPFLSAWIKWDGCMEISMEQTHFCGYNTDLQDIIKEMYTITSTNIEAFDSDLAYFNNN